jgi:hypothetical protein
MGIPGDTPREKLKNVTEAFALLQIIAYPRRGTDEEGETIETIAEKAAKIIGNVKH